MSLYVPSFEPITKINVLETEKLETERQMTQISYDSTLTLSYFYKFSKVNSIHPYQLINNGSS